MLRSQRRYSSRTAGPLKMGPIGCPETSVTNYQLRLRNIAEERMLQLHRGGSGKSRTEAHALLTLL